MLGTRQTKTILLATTAAIFSLAIVSPAMAQDAASATASQADQKAAKKAAAQAAGDNQAGQDIVVTGDRNNRFGTDVVQSGSFRNAKVLDVPLTVSVIPSALLQSQQAIELYDAVRNTAGVSTTGTGTVAYQNITIRGIAVDTRSNFKLDGALNMLSATAFPLEDKDRVEVLKGASALYYGFSTPAGIVNLTMKRPTAELTLSENTFYDSHGGIGEHVDVGDTMGMFGYRLNAVAAHLDTGIQFADGERYLVSGAFDLKPTDKLTLTADVEYFQKSIVEPALFLLSFPATGAKLPDVDRLDPKTNIGGANWDANRTYEYNYLGKAVYKFSSDWNLSGYYGRSHMIRYRNNPQFQLSASGANPALDPDSPTYGDGKVRFSAQHAVFQNTSYAVELAGTQHFGNIRNEILLGAARSIRILASSPNIRFAPPDPTHPAGYQNFIHPRFITDPNLAYTPLPDSSTVDDKGAYIFDRLSFNDIVQVLGGVRWSDYKNDGSINVSTHTPYEAKPTSYSGGLIVKPVKWASVYGTYIQGLEETPAATSGTDNELEVFPPTTSTQWEAGLKLEPKANLLAQLAWFKIDRGAAYAANRPGTNILHYFTDGREIYQGVEVSLSGYVVPDLAINATATVLSAHYRDNLTVGGNRVDGAPKNTWSLFGEYTLSWLDPGLKVNAGVYHTSSQAVDANNDAFTDPYTTFDIGASYAFAVGEHTLIARINGQNITGKRYWASVGGSSLAENVPSAVKFSLAFKY